MMSPYVVVPVPLVVMKNPPQEQHKDLKAYLTKHVLGDNYNLYCVDCTQQKSTFMVV